MKTKDFAVVEQPFAYLKFILTYSGKKPKTEQEAFKGSIKKWRKIVQILEEKDIGLADGGTTTCGLCLFFTDECGYTDCSECPICEHTGYDSCGYTPYTWEWELCNELDAAKSELAFLEELYREWKN